MVTNMFGCCSKAMGPRYWKEDGTVDSNYLKQHYPEGSVTMKIQKSEGGWARSIFMTTGNFPEQTKVVDPKGNIHDICTCPCHNITNGAAFMC